jgi:hypothetical protein
MNPRKEKELLQAGNGKLSIEQNESSLLKESREEKEKRVS